MASSSVPEPRNPLMFAEMAAEPEALGSLLNSLAPQATTDTHEPSPAGVPAPLHPPFEVDAALMTCLGQINHVLLSGCGSSLHAAQLTERALMTLAHCTAQARPAHELATIGKSLWQAPQLLILFSQSGETHDTREALALAQEHACPTLALTAAPTSALSRLSRWHVDTQAGVEHAIPSTKGFLNQWALGLVIALGAAWQRRPKHGPRRHLWSAQAHQTLKHMTQLPQQTRRTQDRFSTSLRWAEALGEVAEHVTKARQTIFLGAGLGVPLAHEGALKLKEAALCPAHASSVGEFKHGPIATVDAGDVVIFVLGPDVVAQARRRAMAIIDALEESGAWVVALASEAHDPAQSFPAFCHPLLTPQSPSPFLWPADAAVVLQRLAFLCAEQREVSADTPRRLVKSIQDHHEQKPIRP